MQLALATSRLSKWFKLLHGSGRKERTSSMPRKFSRWHIGQDPKTYDWRVIDDDHAVICTGLRIKDEAEEIVAYHNSRDPIRSREDWLYAKAS